MNKKGNVILDSGTFLIILLALAIISLTTWMIFSDTNDWIQDDPDLSSEAKSISGDYADVYPDLYDNIFLFVLILLVLFMLISVFFIDTHPAFFIITIVLLLAIFIITPLFANFYSEFASDTTMTAYSNSFPKTNWIMDHLVEMIIGIVFLVAIAMFAKSRT